MRNRICSTFFLSSQAVCSLPFHSVKGRTIVAHGQVGLWAYLPIVLGKSLRVKIFPLLHDGSLETDLTYINIGRYWTMARKLVYLDRKSSTDP